MLTQPELQRYARQMAMPEFGSAAQEKLRAARVLLLGAGGLGSPAAMYLAAAGVGTLGIVDPDDVELSNLHRQILHGTDDIGRAKGESGRERLQSLNPHVQVEVFRELFTASHAVALARGWDVVLDGTDNFPSRYASNDACVALGIPNVYGSVWRFEGQVSVFAPHLGGPCYRCVNPQAPPPGAVPGCSEAGVLGVMPGLIGTLQALEVLKLLTGLGEPLVGRLLHVDALSMKFRSFNVRCDPDCARCAPERRALPVVAEGVRCGVEASYEEGWVSVQKLARARLEGEEHLLLDVREPWEMDVARLDPCLAIPMGEVADRLTEIPEDRTVYVLCHSGVRSARIAASLRGVGRRRVFNVRGGIAAWSAEIDASVPVY